MERLRAVIIEPDAAARVRLREATSAVSEFEQVTLQSNQATVLDELGSPQHEVVNMFFLSYRLERAELVSFIQNAKKLVPSKDAAFTLLLRDEDRNGSAVASNLLVGADGKTLTEVFMLS